MKLFKLLLASLAFVSVSAQANTISTNVYVNDQPSSATVQYVNFFVSDAGTFDISATGITFDALADPYIYLFSSPASNATFITADDDSGSGDNAKIDNVSLALGNYVLAVSNYNFSQSEAINGYNGSVDYLNDGWAQVVISSYNGVAQFGSNNPSAVPAPAAAWLFGSALMGFAGFRRKSV